MAFVYENARLARGIMYLQSNDPVLYLQCQQSVVAVVIQLSDVLLPVTRRVLQSFSIEAYSDAVMCRCSLAVMDVSSSCLQVGFVIPPLLLLLLLSASYPYTRIHTHTHIDALAHVLVESVYTLNSRTMREGDQGRGSKSRLLLSRGSSNSIVAVVVMFVVYEDLSYNDREDIELGRGAVHV